jgi:hypothetical protein
MQIFQQLMEFLNVQAVISQLPPTAGSQDFLQYSSRDIFLTKKFYLADTTQFAGIGKPRKPANRYV